MSWLGLLQVVLIVLKLLGVITITWLQVFIPMILSVLWLLLWIIITIITR